MLSVCNNNSSYPGSVLGIWTNPLKCDFKLNSKLSLKNGFQIKMTKDFQTSNITNRLSTANIKIIVVYFTTVIHTSRIRNFTFEIFIKSREFLAIV